MKKIIFSVFAFLLIAGNASCQERFDMAKEEEAIIKVLYEEGETFAAFDMEGLSALHVKDETATWLAGTRVYSGWNEIEALLKGYIEWKFSFNAFVAAPEPGTEEKEDDDDDD